MSEKKVTIITLACLGFILIAGGAGIWYLQFSVLAELLEKRDQVHAELRKAEEKVAQIPKIKKDIEQNLKPQLAELEKRIPMLDRDEYDKLANLLDSFRRRAGVYVAGGRWTQAQKGPAQAVPGRPAPKAQPAMVHKVQYDFSVSGNFYQLLRYINILEEELRFINVDSFAISKSADSSGGPLKRDLKVTIYSYTYRLPENAPPITIEDERRGKSTDIPE